MPYESSSDPMRHRVVATVRVAAVVACIALTTGVAAVARADDGTPSSGAGMRVYVDPNTGEIIDTPPAEAEEGARARATETAPSATHEAEPVVQQAPGGGVMIDLGDRQQHEMRVTVGKDGAAKTRCLEPGDASGAR